MKQLLRTLLLTVFFLSFLLPSYSQIMRGQVLDANSQQAVSYATIGMIGSKKGVICNGEGKFEWNVSFQPADSCYIYVQCLGYASQQLKWDGSSFLTIYLQPKDFVLDPVSIVHLGLSPKAVLQKAIDQLPTHFDPQPYLLNSFYRHYCKEEGEYRRLIEAAVDLYKPNGHKRRYTKVPFAFQMKVPHMRRSLDFTALSSFRHLPIALNQTLLHDYSSFKIPYMEGFWSNEMRYAFVDTLYDQGASVVVVQVNGRYNGWQITSDFFINVVDFSLLKSEEHWSSSLYEKSYRLIRNNHFVCRYRRFGDRLYLSHIINEGKRISWRAGENGEQLDKEDHLHHISWMVNEVKSGVSHAIRGREPGAEALKNIPYDEAFWASYPVLKATPLESRIRRDLAEQLSLDRQFSSADQIVNQRQWQEKWADNVFQDALSHYQGLPLLICFWKSGDRPSLREILTLRKLNKAYGKEPFGLIWIFVGANKQEMDKLIRKYGLYIGRHIYSPGGFEGKMAQKFNVKQSPFLLLKEANGQEVFRGRKLPPYKKIRATLDELK
ncbi:MAG: carboxypeptidase-like regulatory domain-containing protein [Bacteroidota bacterium]